ncbi:MAG: hypothetical protein JWP08_3804 [Bryobacterales bacterium]|nr:hypothetical protein [Bryobacterales bacterium]
MTLSKPEYLLRPRQFLRRLNFKPQDTIRMLPLPWGTGIFARSSETVGRAIATQGVYDLPVTEALIRLMDPGETALDIGANIGYMSLVLARAAGVGGKVISFEPNPSVLPCLRQNLSMWSHLPVAQIELRSVALSDHTGEENLVLPADFAENEGTARLGSGVDGTAVHVLRLDELQIADVGVMKVDVEGHESAVFGGAAALLRKRTIRDIVFEEHDPYPARSHQILLDYGYRIYFLTRSTLRPLLLPPTTMPRHTFLPTNYIATADAGRTESRMKSWGWRALS